MAKFTQRQLLTTLSVFVSSPSKFSSRADTDGHHVQYLAALTILAAYALHQTNTYSLPIPTILSALTVALPPLAGITLETLISFQYQLSKKGTVKTSKIFQAVNGAL